MSGLWSRRINDTGQLTYRVFDGSRLQGTLRLNTILNTDKWYHTNLKQSYEGFSTHYCLSDAHYEAMKNGDYRWIGSSNPYTSDNPENIGTSGKETDQYTGYCYENFYSSPPPYVSNLCGANKSDNEIAFIGHSINFSMCLEVPRHMLFYFVLNIS